MEGELETFVREVLQNANDAAYSEIDEPVEVDSVDHIGLEETSAW